VISGGYGNRAIGFYAAMGGGYANTAAVGYGTVSGGANNTVSNYYATVAGGRQNTVNGYGASVSGGSGNTAGSNYAAVGGGFFNSAAGQYASIPGGYDNFATGDYSFAAGHLASAAHAGAFVWADSSTNSFFSSTTSNQFSVQATGGVRLVTSGAGLALDGPVQAASFQGDGSGLTNVSSAALGNYVFAYNTGAELVAAANTFQDITFNTDAQINGWTHTAGTAPYTSAQTGLYLIQYDAGASATNATGASISVHASLNLTEIPGSQAAVFLSTNSLQVSSISRSFIASINSSDVLTLQVTGSSTGSRLIATGSGSTRPSVSLTITRIQ